MVELKLDATGEPATQRKRGFDRTPFLTSTEKITLCLSHDLCL